MAIIQDNTRRPVSQHPQLELDDFAGVKFQPTVCMPLGLLIAASAFRLERMYSVLLGCVTYTMSVSQRQLY